MTPETYTPENEPVHHDSAQRPLLLIPCEESTSTFTKLLQRYGYLAGGSPLPKRQKVEEAVTVQ